MRLARIGGSIEYSEAQREELFEETCQLIHAFRASFGELLAPLEESDDLDVESLLGIVGLLGEIFENEAAKVSFITAPKDDRAKLWINDPLIDDIEGELDRLRERLVNLADVSSANYSVETLSVQLVASLRRARLNDFSYMPQPFRDQLAELIESLSEEVDLFERRRGLNKLRNRAQDAVHAAENSATAATTAADATKAAAGIAGDATMSSFYAKMAAKETETADKFRRLTAGFSYAAVATAAIFVLLPSGLLPSLDLALNDYARLLQKAVFVAAIFGLAGYFARQAHQHRSMANWSGSLAVQLQTFDAYLASIDNPGVKDELRKTFAARVFGDHPAMKGEPTEAPTAAAMETAVGWAAKLMPGGK